MAWLCDAGLKVTYSTGHVVQHGDIPVLAAGETRREIHQFTLEPSERIVSATVRAGWMIDQLTFTTSQQRVIGPFGGTGGSEHKLSPDKSMPSAYLAYLRGRVDRTQDETSVRHLVLVWAYLDNKSSTSEQCYFMSENRC